MTKIHKAFFVYLELGYCPIPVSQEKKPLVQWAKYQQKLPSHADITSWMQKYPNCMIGLITGKRSSLFSIDCDTQEAIEKIESILPDSYESIAVETPRGGRHYHFRYPHDITIPTKAALFEGCDIRGEGGYIIVPPSTNGNGAYRYLANKIMNIDQAPDEILSFINSNLLNNKYIYNNYINKSKDNAKSELFSEGRRDNDLFRLANCLVKSGMPGQEIAEYLAFIMHSWGEHDEAWINTKITSALNRQENRENNLTQEIRDWVLLSSSVVILSSDVDREFNLSSRVDKKNRSKILERMKEEGLIEKHGDKKGCFRVVNKELKEINWQNVTNSSLDIVLPLGVTNYCNVNEGNIILVAGCKDAGKSAFCLNTAILNRKKYQIKYYSSEMFEIELQRRMSKVQLHLNIPLEELIKIKFFDRRDNFADVIEDAENTIHIIDFLDVTKDFFLVGDMIKEIFNKLKKSVCLIALQKDYGKDLPRGGSSALDKARIVVTMEKGVAKIISGKDWKTETNPAGLQASYKLIQGCKFSVVDEWH